MAFNIQKTEELKKLINDSKDNIDDWKDEYISQVIKLINEGADYTIKTEDYFENSLLLLAILKKSSKLAELILEKDTEKQLLNYHDNAPDAKNTPLILATKKGNYKIAMKLLELGANPNSVCAQDDMTALHYATGMLGVSYKESNKSSLWSVDIMEEQDLANLIKKLLEKGADPDYKNKFGTTPRDMLCYKFSKLDKEYYQENILIRSFREFFNFPIFDKDWEKILIIFEHMSTLEIYKSKNEDGQNNEKIFKLEEKIETLKNSTCSDFNECLQTYLSYQNFSQNCLMLEDEGKAQELEEYKKANPIFLGFLNEEAKRFTSSRRYYTAKQIIEKAENQDENFSHLKTQEAINLEINKKGGIIIKPQGMFPSSKLVGLNDYYTLISGVAWHREKDNFELESALIKNRNSFLESKEGKSIIEELEKSFKSGLTPHIH